MVATGNYRASDPDAMRNSLSGLRGTFAYTTTLGKMHDAKAALVADPTRTAAAVAVEIGRLVDRERLKIAAKWDASISTLRKNIASMERELAAPVVQQGSQLIAAEIRRHLAELGAAKRQALLEAVIADGDATTVTAALAGPAFLSGLAPEMHRLLTEAWHLRASPDLAERLDLHRRALDLAVDRSALIHKELRKITGDQGVIDNAVLKSKRASRALEALAS
ncbi:MAG: hypothetical protein IPK48_01470 [Gammaproteobacteria bacterium]|nr:hypothetical protein [Gammaproteobacteria bacterium]